MAFADVCPRNPQRLNSNGDSGLREEKGQPREISGERTNDLKSECMLQGGRGEQARGHPGWGLGQLVDRWWHHSLGGVSGSCGWESKEPP